MNSLSWTAAGKKDPGEGLKLGLTQALLGVRYLGLSFSTFTVSDDLVESYSHLPGFSPKTQLGQGGSAIQCQPWPSLPYSALTVKLAIQILVLSLEIFYWIFCIGYFGTTVYYTALHCTELYYTLLHCTILYCTVLYCTVLYSTALYHTVLHCTVLHCTVLLCTVLYCTVPYCTALYCTALYYTVLHCTILYCTVLYCTVLYCTALYHTVLHCTVLHCTILYCTVPYCTALYCTESVPWREEGSTGKYQREVEGVPEGAARGNSRDRMLVFPVLPDSSQGTDIIQSIKVMKL